MTIKPEYRGSEWRKWDLHVHTPLGKLYNGYLTNDGVDARDKFCDELEKSDVQVFGITDYFSFQQLSDLHEKVQEKVSRFPKIFFYNLELRLNETVNKELEEVNVNLLFNTTALENITKFLSKLSVVKTGKDETPIMCSELDDKDLESATVTRQAITVAFKKRLMEGGCKARSFFSYHCRKNELA